MQMEHQHDDEVEIDLQELFFEMLAHWKLILLSTIMAAAIAFVISRFILVPQYQSTSALYVLSESTSITSLADIQIGTNLTSDYIVVVRGRPVLEQVISNLELDETYDSLYEKVDVENPTNSRILQITVTDPDPQRAKRITDELASVASDYIAEKMKQSKPTTIQNGYADGNAVSPNVMRNTALGGAIGLFLAGAVVVLSYLLNDTIMTAEDVERKLGLNLLGSLPEEEAEYDGGKKKGAVSKMSKKKSA